MEDPYEGMLPDDYVEAMRGDAPQSEINSRLRMFAYKRCTYFLSTGCIQPAVRMPGDGRKLK